MFDTRKFDPWKQRTIYEYTRRDAPDSFEIPKPLFDFFLQQTDKYARASDQRFGSYAIFARQYFENMDSRSGRSLRAEKAQRTGLSLSRRHGGLSEFCARYYAHNSLRLRA
jgi:hypothetical protein